MKCINKSIIYFFIYSWAQKYLDNDAAFMVVGSVQFRVSKLTVEFTVGGSIMGWTCMAAYGTGSQLFRDGLTVDSSLRMNSEAYRSLLSAHVQTNGTKLIGSFTTLATLFEGKDIKHSSMAKTVT